MSNRDELAREIFIADNHHARRAVMEAEWAERSRSYPYAYAIADELLAAGYRKLTLPVDGFPTNPTNSGRGNEQDRSNGSQPQQPLHRNTNHGQDQPKSQQNNHQGSHAQSLRPSSDEWNGAGIAPEAIEATAQAMYPLAFRDNSGDFVKSSESSRKIVREDARNKATAALTAAYPLMEAQAKAEGLREAADALEAGWSYGAELNYDGSEKPGVAAAIQMTHENAEVLRARAATIEGKNE